MSEVEKSRNKLLEIADRLEAEAAKVRKAIKRKLSRKSPYAPDEAIFNLEESVQSIRHYYNSLYWASVREN